MRTNPLPTPRSPLSDPLLTLCLSALLFSIYLLTFSGRYHSSDEMSMLVAADSLARRGDWDIELLRWMGWQQGSFGPDGRLYSRKGIGATLAALPLYWLAVHSQRMGNVQAAMLTNSLVTALTGALVYLFLRRLRYGRGVALGVALAYGLGTMAWPYARYLFSESLAGLGLMVSAYFLLRYRDSPRRRESRLCCQDVTLVAAGAGLGAALLARLNNIIVAPLLGLLLLAYLHRRHGRDWRAWIRPVLLFGLPALAALVVVGWYNWLRFGSPLTTGYLPQERFATPFLEGFYGLTLSPGKGLFWYNPLLFAALAAWPAFYRQRRAEALLAAAVVLSNVAFYAPWYLWWAGHAWGPRFLVTILPFAVLPLAPALAAGRRRGLALGLAALAAVSVAVQLLGVAVDFNLYLEDVYARIGLYHPATLFNPAYSPLLRQGAYLRRENLDLAWARGGEFDGRALLLGLGAVTASALALVAAWRRRRSGWVGVGLLALLGLVVAWLLPRYAPTGDAAEIARALAAMERPGEVVVLTNPLLTEAFQDAYDGCLPLRGRVEGEGVGAPGDEFDAMWEVGAAGLSAAPVRFQAGAVRLSLWQSPGRSFDLSRLPIPLWAEPARLGEAVEVVAAQPGGTAVRRGGALRPVLCWRALAPPERSYTVFVQLLDEDDAKAGQVDRLPCDGGCPTDDWQAGDLLCEWYALPIRADAPPGSYRLIAGLYPSAPLRTGDLATGERLPWLDAQGNVLGTYLPLGLVQVTP